MKNQLLTLGKILIQPHPHVSNETNAYIFEKS